MFKTKIKSNKGSASANRRRDGFTLIELLAVIAIIGLLAAIVIVSLQGPRKTARDAKRKADLRNLQTAMELCYGDNACGGSDEYITYADYAAAKLGGIPGYVNTTGMPDDPLVASGEQYQWQDNTATGIGDQNYCMTANIEEGDFFWVADHGSGENATRACP